MSSPEMAEQLQPRDYNTHPLTDDEMRAILDSPEFERAWNDPATHEGAIEALARAEADLAARGELMEDPYPWAS
jgi:hypothetical protein